MSHPGADSAAPWTTLLRPRWLGLLHAPAAASPGRRAAGGVFVLLGVAFWVGIFFGSLWFFRRCLGVELLGPLLVRRVLDMAFVVFLSVLLFSNLVAAFSTFYLADELPLLHALPVHTDRLHWARLAETALQSSWMMLIFGVPLLAAAGVAFGAPWPYYVLVALVLPPFLLLPAVVGSAVTTGLVLVFPARRARDLLALLGLLGFCVLFVLFRVMEPERLLDESQFGDLMSVLATFRTPQAAWLPSSWAVQALFPALRGDPLAGASELLVLYLSAGAALVAGTWGARPLYRRAYGRSQEGQGGGRRATRRRAAGPLRHGSPLAELLRKDLLLFVRDPSQWSQTLLLLAVVVVYVVNFKHFGMLRTTGLIGELGLFHLNLGLTAFVMAAVGVRLVFPAVSLEGRAFWMLRTSPLPLRSVLRAKLVAGLVPTLGLGTVTIGITGWLLETSAPMVAVSLATVWLLGLLVSALGIGLGALYPSFEAQNATRIASGFGGVVYMVLSMSATLAVLVLQAGPAYVVHRWLVRGASFPLRYWVAAGLLQALALLIVALGTWLPMRLGERNLRSA